MLSITTPIQDGTVFVSGDTPGIKSLRTKGKVEVNGTAFTVLSKKKDKDGFRLTLESKLPTFQAIRRNPNSPNLGVVTASYSDVTIKGKIEPELHCEPGLSIHTITRKQRNRLKKGTPLPTSAKDGEIEVEYPSRSRKNRQRQHATVKGGQIISLKGIAVASH